MERHNELVQVVGAAITKPARREVQPAPTDTTSQPESSRLLGEHDVVKYDEQALMHFLQTRCVTYAMGSRLNFDFKQPEQRLRRDLSACYRDRVATFNGSVRLSYRRRSKLPSSRKSCCRTSPIISRQKSARRRSPTIACRRFRQRLPSSRSPAVSQASKQTRCI